MTPIVCSRPSVALFPFLFFPVFIVGAVRDEANGAIIIDSIWFAEFQNCLLLSMINFEIQSPFLAHLANRAQTSNIQSQSISFRFNLIQTSIRSASLRHVCVKSDQFAGRTNQIQSFSCHLLAYSLRSSSFPLLTANRGCDHGEISFPTQSVECILNRKFLIYEKKNIRL